jgi:hypothetical protein
MANSVTMPTEAQLREEFRSWFQAEYGVRPVETSSTGLPAVHFAQYILKRYAPLLQSDAGEG